MGRLAVGVSFLLFASASTAFGYGEPSSAGLPNHEERLLHVLTNQVRQAPHDWPDWDTGLATASPRGPLFMENALFEAARFHANDMAATGHFDHTSSDGTSFGARLSRYFSGPVGENILHGFGSRARSSITLWMNSEGHRINILTGEWNRLGTGFAARESDRYYVQDFGQAPGSPSAIPGGAFERVGGSILLIANFFDAGGRPATSMEAVLGNRTIPLEHVAGPPGNETLQASIAEPAECETLYFRALDGAGNQTVFPTTGALLAGKACTSEFQAATPTGQDRRPVIDADESGCACVTSRSRSFAPLFLAFVFAFLLRTKRAVDSKAPIA